MGWNLNTELRNFQNCAFCAFKKEPSLSDEGVVGTEADVSYRVFTLGKAASYTCSSGRLVSPCDIAKMAPIPHLPPYPYPSPYSFAGLSLGGRGAIPCSLMLNRESGASRD